MLVDPVKAGVAGMSKGTYLWGGAATTTFLYVCVFVIIITVEVCMHIYIYFDI